MNTILALMYLLRHIFSSYLAIVCDIDLGVMLPPLPSPLPARYTTQLAVADCGASERDLLQHNMGIFQALFFYSFSAVVVVVVCVLRL